MNITGKWKGFYDQELGTDEEPYLAEFDFEIVLKESEDGFYGFCKDLEIEAGQKEEAKIKGFTEDGLISFIKQYNNSVYYESETDVFILEKEPSTIEINYYGNWDEESNKYSGTWEIVLEDLVGLNEIVTTTHSGYWEMTKVV